MSRRHFYTETWKKTCICLNRQASHGDEGERSHRLQTEEKPIQPKTSTTNVVLEVQYLYQSARLQAVWLWPMHVHSAIGQRVPNLSKHIRWWHAHCRENSNRDLKTNVEPSRQIYNEGTRTSQHILGHADRVRLVNEDSLTQSDYIHKVMKRFNMENAKPTSTPLPTTIRLSDRDSPSTEEERKLNGKIPYASAVGSIMYAMVATRPNLAYVVGMLQQCYLTYC